MGALTAFDLQPWIEKFNIENFIETGTGDGTSLKYALSFPFKKLYSVDFDEKMYNKAMSISDSRLNLYNDYSTVFLKEVLPSIKGNSLIYLDAHLGKSDYGEMSQEEALRIYKEQALPLKQEIEIILQSLNIQNSIIIIDDWILYSPYHDYDTIKEGVIWKHSQLQKELGLETNEDQIVSLLAPYFSIEVATRHQGYLICTPKDSNKNEI